MLLPIMITSTDLVCLIYETRLPRMPLHLT
ncbi:hypothetical protein PENDEC_c063G02721 [Penicillium decumbens]|uniref:Uncharacterized protein n=1 Tax=Penicillium decumbens TaxID=69771 RepID=A0A1V6NNW3_PENDC|nr:hypothetical protein PENDEC_c063G02721 [Penicillium decumbens]